MANESANIIDGRQAELRALIMKTLSEQAPEFLAKLNGKRIAIRRHALFVKPVLNTLSSVSPFDLEASGTAKYESNFNSRTLPADKAYVVAGLQIQTARTTTANATMDTLVFVEPTVAGVLNSLITLEFGNKKVVDNQRVQALIENGDAMPSYFRFPELRVWSENTELRMLQQFPAVYTPGGANIDHELIQLQGFIVELA